MASSALSATPARSSTPCSPTWTTPAGRSQRTTRRKPHASTANGTRKSLWRATELNYAIYTPGATTATTNIRRRLVLKNPAEGAFYGTIGQLDDTGRANYNGMLLSAQKRLTGGLSALTNYTLSKCMTDPATTELTGPTITDPTNPGLDYSYCDADRRHVVNVYLVARTPSFTNHTLGVILSDWQVAPIVRWQSGSRFTVTTGVDNALSGQGGQRAVQVLDDPFGDGTVNNYLNRNAFASPDPGTYSTLRPNAFVGPSQFQNDLARDPHVRLRRAQAPVPLGDLQRAEQGQLQQPDVRIEQHELRPDSDGGSAAHHAVRVQVRFLIQLPASGFQPRAWKRA